MKRILSLSFFALTLNVMGQSSIILSLEDIDNLGNDTVFILNETGIVKNYYFLRNDTLYILENFDKGACRKLTGCYFLDRENGILIQSGEWRWYRKNGNIMDIGIYDEGNLIHRKRFNRKGFLSFENYSEY